MKRTSPIPLLDREVLLRAANLNNAEARFLVEAYYADQEKRKRADMQKRHLGDRHSDDSALFLNYIADVHASTEEAIAKMLDKYSAGNIVGQWMRRQVGVGPIIAAGFLAYLDITKAPSAGHFWAFAGQDPTRKWEKGQKRPYSAQMKQLVYHLGEGFKKVSNKPDAMYGHIYRSRKQFIVARNEAGYNAERAKTYITREPEVKKLLAEGKLPPINLDRQACNYAAKIFLSHLHVVMFWDYHKAPPKKPFAMSILGHVHEIMIPDMDMFPGLCEAYYGVRQVAMGEERTVWPERTEKGECIVLAE